LDKKDERNIRATAEEKGLEKGIKQGKEEGVKHVALELLKAGVLPLAEISKYTGLSLEQLEELRQNV
jgi:predicted transposase/invertase (TIGR01784 family)